MDSRFPYCIVAIVLHQYINECPAPGTTCVETITAKLVNEKHIDGLLADIGPVAAVDNGIRSIVSAYNPPASATYNKIVRGAHFKGPCVRRFR